MFGLKFIKTQPTVHLRQYVRGRLRREGSGLAFFYYAPTTALVAIPLSSTEASFIFNEVTADFQEITLQGQVTYRITDPAKIAALLDFNLDPSGQGYASDDPQKLSQRVINTIQVLVRAELQKLPLRDALRSSDILVRTVATGLSQANDLVSLGLEILGLSILAIKPTPETARALEAEAREELLKKADEAVYARRNSAVQLERAIKENELNTEIAVETKKRQVRETQMDAERAVQEKKNQMRTEDMSASIARESQNAQLVDLATTNARKEADAKAYAASALMQAFAGVDGKVIQALASTGMQPDQLIAAAFRDLAENAQKIGELNISPELLRELLNKKPAK